MSGKFNQPSLSKKANWALSIFLLLLAGFVRCYGLSKHSTIVDEVSWISMSGTFMKNICHLNFSPEAWGVTLHHPGVITSCLCGISISLWLVLFSGLDIDSILHLKPRSAALLGMANPNDLSFLSNLDLSGFLSAARLPFALVGALSVLTLYLLVKRIYNWQVGFISALFLALSPYYIGMSRYPLTDQVLTFFLMCAILLYALGEKENNGKLKLLSGVSWALALLSKIPALIAIGILFVWKIVPGWQRERKLKSLINVWSSNDIKWLLIGLGLFVLLYPRFWGDLPHHVIRDYLKLFFCETAPRLIYLFGQVMVIPSYYYLVMLPMVLDEMLLFSLAIGFLWLIYYLFSRKSMDNNHLLLLFWVVIFVACMSIMGHKGMTHMMPIWPVLCILGALGLLKTIRTILLLRLKETTVNKVAPLIAAIIILTPGTANLFTYYPDYCLYYNSYIGGYKGVVEKRVLLPCYDAGKAVEYISQFGKGLKIAVLCPEGSIGLRNITKLHYPGGNVVSTLQPGWEDADFLIVPVSAKICPDSPASLYAGTHKRIHTVKVMGAESAWIYKL